MALDGSERPRSKNCVGGVEGVGIMAGSASVIAVDLDATITAGEQHTQEQAAAIDDFLARNHFSPTSNAAGPYHLRLAFEDHSVVFHLRDKRGNQQQSIRVDLHLLSPIMADYALICDSYHDAIGGGSSAARIEAIDSGRRDLHDAGSKLLLTQLEGQLETDMETARHLFTLLRLLTPHLR